jgi:tripartite-type tricarboxylate transporter receptor subunit TctC
VIQLSEFSVKADANRGYAPSETMTGSRVATQIVDLPHIVTVHPNVAAKSIGELVALLKAKPGQIAAGFSGIGTSTHLAIELFQYMSQTKMLLVPYKGGAPAMTALLGGEVQVNFATSSTGIPHIRSGKLRGLAVTGAKRSTAIPELPTVAEAGVKGYLAINWYGLSASPKTPPAILARLNKDFTAALNAPDVVKQLKERGIDSAPSSGADYAKFIVEEQKRWVPVIQKAKIEAN